MTNEKFSKTPGSTSIHNGGNNIRTRIENIARFKKYPQGMKLVSVCILIVLALPLFMGAKAESIPKFPHSVKRTLASARSTPCTTYAGAFDAYGKAILDRNGYYRAMCASESMQQSLESEMLEKDGTKYPLWNSGLEEWANGQEGYYIYNLVEVEKNVYEGLLVVELNNPPNEKQEEFNVKYLAVQNLRVEKENGRWVVIPLENFRYVETIFANIGWGCFDLPGIVYAGEAHDFRIEIMVQTTHTVNSIITEQNDLWFLSNSYYDMTPNPNAKFDFATRSSSAQAIYLGGKAQKDRITHIGLSYAPVYEGDEHPKKLTVPLGYDAGGSSSSGECWNSMTLKPGWNTTIDLPGGGTGMNPDKKIKYPLYYAADLYINGEKVAEIDLSPTKGGTLDE